MQGEWETLASSMGVNHHLAGLDVFDFDVAYVYCRLRDAAYVPRSVRDAAPPPPSSLLPLCSSSQAPSRSGQERAQVGFTLP